MSDCGHLLYMHVPTQALHIPDTVYHAALRFITNFKHLIHRCELYSQTGSFMLTVGRSGPLFIFYAILVLLPFYLCTSIPLTPDRHMFPVPSVQTENGKMVFRYSPSEWNYLQSVLKTVGTGLLIYFKIPGVGNIGALLLSGTRF